jgi:hypothetical protein
MKQFRPLISTALAVTILFADPSNVAYGTKVEVSGAVVRERS